MRLFASKLGMWVAGIASSLAIVLALSAPAAAVDLFPPEVCKGAAGSSAACSATGQDNITGSDGVIIKVANLMAIISGAVAVFMILLGGFFFITAGGDANKVSSAKNIIVYTVVGLIVILLARSIVVFFVSKV